MSDWRFGSLKFWIWTNRRRSGNFVQYLEKNNLWYGVVSYNSDPNRNHGGLFIHDTYRQKWGGRTHIDTGCPDVHLMLDRHDAPMFIDYIKSLRASEWTTNGIV